MLTRITLITTTTPGTMKKLLILIISLTNISTILKAQPSRVEPFDDAVPYSLQSPSTLYLTNRDAAAVRDFFTGNGKVQPERIIPVEEGYYSGYRLCYGSEACNGNHSTARWIQVLTIDSARCMLWYRKNHPELLMAPFNGLLQLSGQSRDGRKEFRKVFERYKYLACRLYRQTEDHNGLPENEMALVIRRTSGRMEMETSQMLASGGDGVMLLPSNNLRNQWNICIQSLEELEMAGYTTLIEYSDPPAIQ